MEYHLDKERRLNYSLDKSINNRKEPDVQHKDISYAQSVENTQDEEGVSHNQNDKVTAIEEIKTKKGYWSRLFGG